MRIALALMMGALAVSACARRDLDWSGLSREVGQRTQPVQPDRSR